MPFKLNSGGFLEARLGVTAVPYDDRDNAQPIPMVYRWPQSALDTMNQWIRDGVVTAEYAIQVMSKYVVMDVVDPATLHPHDTGIADVEFNRPIKQRKPGEGVDGLEFQKRNPKKHHDSAADLGFGYTRLGVPVKPRRKRMCDAGHVVTGDNAYIVARNGQQLCVACLKQRHKDLNDRVSNIRRNR